MKSFHLGVICPQNPELGGGQTGTSRRTGYRSRDALQRDTVLRVVVQGQRVSRVWSNFFVQHTVAQLRGIKIAQFSDFGPFSPYKTPWSVLGFRGVLGFWGVV